MEVKRRRLARYVSHSFIIIAANSTKYKANLFSSASTKDESPPTPTPETHLCILKTLKRQRGKLTVLK